MTRRVRIRYVAMLREQRGLGDETIETAAATASDLYAELCARHGFTLPAGRLRAAVNDTFVPWAHPLREGDEVTYIPPVAGG